MSFKGTKLSLLSFGVEAVGTNDQSLLKAQAAFLGEGDELHGYTDLEVDTRQIPVPLRLKLQEVRDGIEAHMRSLHFEGTENGHNNAGPAEPRGASPGGIAERFKGHDDPESFEQGGG